MNLSFLYKDRSDNTLVQLFRYTWVGGIAFIIDYLTLFLLTENVGVNYLISAAIAFVMGLITNYVFSTIWVFKNSRFKSRMSEFFIFTIIGVIGLGLNEIVIFICCQNFHFHYMISKLLSTVFVFLWNFFGRKYIIFTNNLNI